MCGVLSLGVLLHLGNTLRYTFQYATINIFHTLEWKGDKTKRKGYYCYTDVEAPSDDNLLFFI